MSQPMLSFEEALEGVLREVSIVHETESVPLLDAAGRILAGNLASGIDVPPLDNAAMDGYAVRCADLPEIGTRLPVSQRIPAGTVGQPLQPGTAARIFTGAPIPRGADAVVLQEHCVAEGDQVVVNEKAVPGMHIRSHGEDIAAGREVLYSGTRLGAAELGVAASIGMTHLTVFRRLRVALFSTGDELSMPGEPLKPGGIYNSNRTTLHALLNAAGCEVSDFGIVPDQLAETRRALGAAASGHDLILTSGGVSIGEEDHVKPAVESEGRLDMWQIAIKPGRPFAYGSVGRAAFIGLPGNPVASFVTFLMLVRPFIRKAQGGRVVTPRSEERIADFHWKGHARREFLRARVNQSGHLDLFSSQGSGVLTSCTWAHGFVDNPPGNHIERGQSVRFLPFTELI